MRGKKTSTKAKVMTGTRHLTGKSKTIFWERTMLKQVEFL